MKLWLIPFRFHWYPLKTKRVVLVSRKYWNPFLYIHAYRPCRCHDSHSRFTLSRSYHCHINMSVIIAEALIIVYTFPSLFSFHVYKHFNMPIDGFILDVFSETWKLTHNHQKRIINIIFIQPTQHILITYNAIDLSCRFSFFAAQGKLLAYARSKTIIW